MDFTFWMFIALLVTGGIWLADALVARGRGKRERRHLTALVVEYARAFFPVILVVFLLRAFLVEPFRIPSGSMLPSLVVGDFILVNKYTYGIRLPIVNVKLLEVGAPRRGDVMVFRYPHNPSINYIKRVVGVPGDRIVYSRKTLYINGRIMAQTPKGSYRFSEGAGQWITARRLEEDLDGVRHDILLDDRISQGPVEIEVPPGKYFVMGDNRDHSNDSRFWGFVDDRLIVGKAFLIWFSLDAAGDGWVNWGRIGHLIR